jgi:hypothetical protein
MYPDGLIFARPFSGTRQKYLLQNKISQPLCCTRKLRGVEKTWNPALVRLRLSVCDKFLKTLVPTIEISNTIDYSRQR